MKKILLTYSMLFVAWLSLNAQDVIYESLFDNNNFSTQLIDYNLSAGATDGDLSVSPSGSASYTIPITIPPGTGDAIPSLSLAYSSQSGSGLLGMGWNIAGLSAITRTGKNQVYDNLVSPVTLSNEDFFNLDGNRLVLTSGANGIAGSTYGTKMETFSKVTAYGSMGGSPQYFIVEAKNGMIYEYGSSIDSRFMSADGTKVITWQLNKAKDQYGNYLEYVYETIDGEFRIKQINYTGNSTNNLLPYNQIAFDYKTRKDKNTVYINGETVTSKSIITKIRVTTENNKPVRTYEFVYGLKNDKSYLKKVSEAGTDGKFVNPTIFKYGLTTTPITLNVKPDFQNLDADFFSGDYDGDGFTDLVVAKRFKENNTVYHSGFSVYRTVPIANSNDVSYQLSYTKVFDTPLRIRIEIRPTSYNATAARDLVFYSGISPDDFNGDGKSDIILVYTNRSTSGYNVATKIEILTPNNNATDFTSINCPIPTSSGSSEFRIISNRFFYTGDFDGDNKTDYLLVGFDGAYLSYPSKSLFNRYLLVGEPGSGIPTSSLIDLIYPSKSVSIIDFNGDGKNELMVQTLNSSTNTYWNYSNKTDIYSFEMFSTTEGLMKLVKTHSSSTVQTKYDINTGDFNGDGKTDLLTSEINSDQPSGSGYEKNIWEIWYSTGKEFKDKVSFTFPGSGSYPVMKDDRVLPADFNGDGMTDIAYFKKQDNDLYELYLFTNNGNNNFTTQPKFDLYYPQGISFDDLIIGDFNGDGILEIIDVEKNTNNTAYNTRHFKFFPKTQERLLTGIIDGMKVESSVEYALQSYGKTGANDRVFYQKNGINDNSIIYTTMPSNLVTAIEIPSGENTGTSSTNRYEYMYEDAQLHRGGYGYLGFKKFTTYDRTNETQSTVEFEILTNASILTTAEKKETVKHYGQSRDLSEKINYNNIVLNGNRYWLNTTKIEQKDLLTGGFITKDFLIDANGNVYNEKTNTNNEEYSTIDRGNFVAIGNNIPTLPSYQTVYNSRSNPDGYYTISKNVEFQYYPQGAVKTTKEFNSDKTSSFQTDIEYDMWGNTYKTTISASGLLSKVSLNTYDSKGRFVEIMTNNLGQKSYKTYCPEWGSVKSSKGIDGFITTNEYDGLGRLIKITSPQGHIKSINYSPWIKGYKTITTQTNSPRLLETYDFLGRLTEKQLEITTIKSGFNNYNIVTFKNYNKKGLLRTEYIPFKDDGSPSRYIRTDYDFLNRTQSVKTEGIDGETTYAYTYNQGKSTVEVTNNSGQKSSQTTDASGKVISTTDHGGTMTFKYDGSGNQIEVKLNGAIVATMEYDTWGNQKSLTDANAGKTEYEYNTFDELIRQKDAKGNQYFMEYDEIGRLKKRTGPPTEGVTTTKYVTSGFGINQVEKITSFNGITEDYEYDEWHRVKKVTETIDGVPYAKGFAYNSYNQLASTTYPSGLITNNTYNTEGMLTKVTAGTQLLFDAADGERDAFGHWTKFRRGDNINRFSTAEYNPYGTPTRFYTEGVQDLRMDWDLKTGNLNYRQDARRNLRENFTYDNLNRLTQAHVVGLQPYTFAFEDNGNIKSKTDAGSDYFYDATKFNAVKHVKRSTQTAIPSMQQDITYTPFLRCSTITEGANKLEYTYASDYERCKGVFSINNIVENTRLYLGDYEINTDKNGVKTFVHYLSAAEAIVVKSDNGGFQYYYPYTDHLGSVVAVTNVTGIVAEQNFDAWGRKRNPATWDYANVPTVPSWLYRGFTGHEHLDAFGLINMNARLYDPVLGRMLSPDNYIGSGGTQGFNRYSYANNNPLKFTDPDGNFAFIPFLIAAAVQGVISVGINAAVNWATDRPLFEGAVSSFVTGAVGGAVGNWAGQLLSKGGRILKIGHKIGINLLSGAATLATGAAFFGQKITLNSILATVGAAVAGPYVERFIGKIAKKIQMNRALKQAKIAAEKRFKDLIKELEGGLSTREAYAIRGGTNRAMTPDHSVGKKLITGADELLGGTVESTSKLPAHDITKPKIGLGLDDDLANLRGTGAITYKGAGWQNAGLTKTDWGRAIMDNSSFRESFREAADNAGLIFFDVTNFNPNYAKPGVTNFEFNYILGKAELLAKTVFIQNGTKVNWNGSNFTK